MALYEYRCKTCDSTFELRRPMNEANAPAECPDGHPGAVRLLSVFASVGASGASPSAAPCGVPAPVAARGCGSACGCH
jgi:putative FmdB family regulatory protein